MLGKFGKILQDLARILDDKYCALEYASVTLENNDHLCFLKLWSTPSIFTEILCVAIHIQALKDIF